MAWDDDKKARAVELYLEREPTAENTMEVVKEVADEMGESPNGVRMILTKAGKYVTKTPGAKPASAGGAAKPAGGTRVSKEASQASLVAAIEAAGQTADMEIISKLTGKAAVYLTTVITAANEK